MKKRFVKRKHALKKRIPRIILKNDVGRVKRGYIILTHEYVKNRLFFSSQFLIFLVVVCIIV